MTTSKWIAGLIGPTLVAIAVAMLINLNSMPELTDEISHEPMLILVSGILLFVAGLAIIRVHNHWGMDWQTAVTVLGWLAIFAGLVRMLFPVELATVISGVGQRSDIIGPALIVFLLLGIFLTYKAYGSE
jgi:hypothetical protein